MPPLRETQKNGIECTIFCQLWQSQAFDRKARVWYSVWTCYSLERTLAAVAKLADALASGASARKGVRVQVPPAAPIQKYSYSQDQPEISQRKFQNFLGDAHLRFAQAPARIACAVLLIKIFLKQRHFFHRGESTTTFPQLKKYLKFDSFCLLIKILL